MQLLLEGKSTKQGAGSKVIQEHKNYCARADLRCICSQSPSDHGYKECFKERCQQSAPGSQEITSSQLGLTMVYRRKGLL